MPILMGLSSSHAPGLFQFHPEGWERVHEMLHTNRGSVLSPETLLETPEVLEERIVRIKHSWETFHDQLAAFKPDAFIAVIGDQREWFDSSNIPNIMVYNGPDQWGVRPSSFTPGTPPVSRDDPSLRFPVHIDRELSGAIAEGLVKEGFDAAQSSKMNPMSQPARGVPHGFSSPAPHMLPDMNLPVVLVYVNVDDGPPAILSGERCYELGQAIARICEKSGKRIAIYGSGGMSHNPGGPRASWVDEPLDHWFLDQLTTGQSTNLKSMFSFNSENFIGGTGELRCWITVAGAMDYVKPGHKAVKVDYIPARKTTTGSGWVYWPPIDVPAGAKQVEAAAVR